MSRLIVQTIPTFLGDCFAITDNQTGNNVEVMGVQLSGVIKTDRTTGSFPHGGWDKHEGSITIYHDENRDNHEVTFTAEEFEEAKGAV